MQYPFLKPSYYYSLFKDISGYVRRPVNKKNLDKPIKFKIYDTIGLFMLKVLFLIPISILMSVIHDPENLSKSNMMERFSPLLLLLVAGVILPTVEEIAFRLSLKFKPAYLALSMGVFAYYILTKTVYYTKISAIDESFATRAGMAIGLMVLLYPIINTTAIKEKLTNVWDTHFRVIYYLSCMIFAGIHIFNYELSWINLALLPLITLPQLMSAIIAGYTRVSFGFQYPLFFHMANNLIAIGIAFLPFEDVIY